jgi:hypothetical protein
MDDKDFNQLNNSSITKTHEEIIEMLEEIKVFEKKYGILSPEESIIEKQQIDFEYVKFEEIKPDLVVFKEIDEKHSIFDKIKRFKIDFKIFRKNESIEKIHPPKNPTTFRLRINKEGILENIDVKKPKPRKKIKFNFRKKDKKKSESSEEKSKFSKLINGLSKIKRIIPRKGTEEESESEKTESTEES